MIENYKDSFSFEDSSSVRRFLATTGSYFKKPIFYCIALNLILASYILTLKSAQSENLKISQYYDVLSCEDLNSPEVPLHLKLEYLTDNDWGDFFPATFETAFENIAFIGDSCKYFLGLSDYNAEVWITYPKSVTKIIKGGCNTYAVSHKNNHFLCSNSPASQTIYFTLEPFIKSRYVFSSSFSKLYFNEDETFAISLSIGSSSMNYIEYIDLRNSTSQPVRKNLYFDILDYNITGNKITYRDRAGTYSVETLIP